jgi:hypothetical protein
MRVNIAFSATGRDAACLVAEAGSGRLVVESWTLTEDGPCQHLLRTGTPESLYSQPVPLGDGRVLVARQAPGAHELALLAPSGRRTRQRRIATVDSAEFRLLPSADRGAPPIALSTSADGTTAVFRVGHDAGRLVPLVRLDWPLRTGVWLDRAAGRLATNRGATPVLVDLARGTIDPLPLPAGTYSAGRR